MMAELEIAEIPYNSGEMHFRYARYMSADGKKWIRHGLFQAYHRNGKLASEGHYLNDLEHGHWKDFHENGQIAAEGDYDHGQEVGVWKFWKLDGTPDSD
jgi:antitoxin component YwqK of YwqJK toxin-antitoxin module